MTLPEHIERCEREIQQCREAAKKAGNDADRYGLTWAEVDWIVAKQIYEDELRAADSEIHPLDKEDEDGFSHGC